MKRFLSHVLDVRYDLSVTKGDTKTNHKLQHIELTNDITATDYCCSGFRDFILKPEDINN